MGPAGSFCTGLDLRGLASCAPGAPGGFAGAGAGVGGGGGAGGIKAARRRHERATQGMESLGLLCRLAFLIARRRGICRSIRPSIPPCIRLFAFLIARRRGICPPVCLCVCA